MQASAVKVHVPHLNKEILRNMSNDVDLDGNASILRRVDQNQMPSPSVDEVHALDHTPVVLCRKETRPIPAVWEDQREWGRSKALGRHLAVLLSLRVARETEVVADSRIYGISIRLKGLVSCARLSPHAPQYIILVPEYVSRHEQ